MVKDSQNIYIHIHIYKAKANKIVNKIVVK